MAWISMIAGLLFPLLLLATDSPQLGAIAAPFYLFIGAVVGAYIGFSCWDDKNFKDVYEKTYEKGFYDGEEQSKRHRYSSHNDKS
jgi:hypothetical protein